MQGDTTSGGVGGDVTAGVVAVDLTAGRVGPEPALATVRIAGLVRVIARCEHERAGR
jgi:hypothetical protein